MLERLRPIDARSSPTLAIYRERTMNEGFVGDMSFMPFSPGLRERRAAFHLEAPIVSSYGIATEPEVILTAHARFTASSGYSARLRVF